MNNLLFYKIKLLKIVYILQASVTCLCSEFSLPGISKINSNVLDPVPVPVLVHNLATEKILIFSFLPVPFYTSFNFFTDFISAKTVKKISQFLKQNMQPKF